VIQTPPRLGPEGGKLEIGLMNAWMIVIDRFWELERFVTATQLLCTTDFA